VRRSSPEESMSDNLAKEIQTRKEYIESLMSDFASGQIVQEKLIAELVEEFNKLYAIVQAFNSQISQRKEWYNLLINIILSMPEVQNNASLTAKLKQFYPEDSHP